MLFGSLNMDYLKKYFFSKSIGCNHDVGVLIISNGNIAENVEI